MGHNVQMTSINKGCKYQYILIYPRKESKMSTGWFGLWVLQLYSTGFLRPVKAAAKVSISVLQISSEALLWHARLRHLHAACKGLMKLHMNMANMTQQGAKWNKSSTFLLKILETRLKSNQNCHDNQVQQCRILHTPPKPAWSVSRFIL